MRLPGRRLRGEENYEQSVASVKDIRLLLPILLEIVDWAVRQLCLLIGTAKGQELFICHKERSRSANKVSGIVLLSKVTDFNLTKTLIVLKDVYYVRSEDRDLRKRSLGNEKISDFINWQEEDRKEELVTRD